MGRQPRGKCILANEMIYIYRSVIQMAAKQTILQNNTLEETLGLSECRPKNTDRSPPDGKRKPHPLGMLDHTCERPHDDLRTIPTL